MGQPVDLPSNTPLSSSTSSASCREVVILLCPGRRRFSSLLDEFQVNVDAGRHAVDHAADGSTVTLAERGQRKPMAKRVTHGSVRSLLRRSLLHRSRRHNRRRRNRRHNGLRSHRSRLSCA